MQGPKLFTTYEEIEGIKKQIQKYDWYAQAYDRIKKDVDVMLEKGFQVPDKKGYVFYTHCPRHEERLTFDPYGEDNICPICGMQYIDEDYKGARTCTYHHWLSQMAIKAGIVYLVSEEACYAEMVRKILLDYVRYYPDYPNNDNELGTTKVFQSTYMESVWITYLAGAYDMVKEDKAFSSMDRLRIVNDLFRVSAGVIMDYDEKNNNRQAFNNCGLCAVALVSDDRELLDYALNGPHGFVFHMSNSVLEDGMWYEGDNYHFATVPSLVNIAEMCLRSGIDLYEQEFCGHMLRHMFQAPLVSLQPDLTFPSRKDSPYKTCISQRWYSGLYELAYRRYRDPAFGEILKKMYSRRSDEDESFHNAAGIMDIFPAEAADRSCLDWRGFLNAVPDLGNDGTEEKAVCATMDGTGLSIIRRGAGNYCSLDYGHYGGEHGHPDRLQLTFFARGRRWLTDYGTGQYYFDHLSWYRSTLGHNTVVIDEKNHEKAEGTEVIFEQTREFTILEAVVPQVISGVDMSRTLILFEGGVLFDFVQMESETAHQYDYVLHSLGTLQVKQQRECDHVLSGKGAYRFLEDARSFEAEGVIEAVFQDKEAGLHIRMMPVKEGKVYTARSYGCPYHMAERFPVLGVRQNASACSFAVLMEDVEGQKPGEAELCVAGNSEYEIRIAEKTYRLKRQRDGWNIRTSGGGQEEAFLFVRNMKTKKDGKPAPEKKKEASITPVVYSNYTDFHAGSWNPNLFLENEDQIIRAETIWKGRDDLSAEGQLSVIGGQDLVLELQVRDNTACFIGGKYKFDNDSIQLYFGRNDGLRREYLVLPVTEEGFAKIWDCGKDCYDQALGVSAEQTEAGYFLTVSIPFSEIGGKPAVGEQMEFDVVINDRDQGVRRDKQMIWSGNPRAVRTYLKEVKHPDGQYGSIKF